MSPDFQELLAVAIEAAQAAGSYIQKEAQRDIEVLEKEGGSSRASQVVTEVDQAAEALILKHLMPSIAKYDLALLAEESRDDGSRFKKDYFWCIDPLDGTLAFIEKRPDYAVSIALVARDGTPIIGVVYDPNREILYHALKGEGAYRNGEAWQLPSPNKHLTYVTDHPLENSVGRKQIEAEIERQQKELGFAEMQIISGGGLVINAMRTAENAPAFMLKVPKEKPGCGSIWDYAATACICQELGMSIHTYSGGTLSLNRHGSTFMNEGGMYYRNGI